ncbi:hypothetical protein H0H81_012736 [Sphagnurus paluster]|uniref:Sec20 C-terminal domain-containing protein n=1 Tax=Sphagnurus paluster TaxID=117069 RepID=A0A9P7FUC9_9AGAR|nr:hypothetical protein H0H81_012736 [Sphagnurus paluster]
MPPVPITFTEDISRQISASKRRQNDLAEFQIPRLRTCTGPLSLQQRLAAELREDIELFAHQVETLDICVGDQRGERNRAELRRIVDELQEGLSQLRRDSRAALLHSKRTIDGQSKSQREELLASAAATEKQNSNEKVTEDALMKANNDVTEALRRTIGLMQGELERSVLSTQMLDSSTASLRATSLTHDTLTDLMSTSKHLITALEKSDWIDRVLIISAFIFFILVVLFIVKQRILDRSLRVALWWTRFLPDFSGDSALLNMEKGSASVVLSSVTATASASVSMVSASLSVTQSLSEAADHSDPTAKDLSSSSLETLYSEVTASAPASSETASSGSVPTSSPEAQTVIPDTSHHVLDEL